MNGKWTVARIGTETLGMIVLAIGLMLSAEIALGTSPLTSIAFAWLGQTFANMTLVMFLLSATVQIKLWDGRFF